jgi:large subunit ribosomal protein L25
MADVASLNCQKRQKVGTSESRRLRKQGLVPANVYGHQEEPLLVTVDHDELMKLVQHGEQILELSGDATDLAVVKELQWDTFGTHLLHADLVRVDRNEKVELEVPLELKGTPAGVLAGGILETPLHTIQVRCAAYQIPGSIVVRVNSLQIGDSIHVRDLQLSAGVETLLSGDDLVLQVVAPREFTEEEAGGLGGPVEPELIGGAGSSEDEG